jgi:Family of unknown function (DUF6526)
MENTGQNLDNHVRWHPPFHFFAVPVLGIHVLWSLYGLWQNPGMDAGEGLLLALALLIIGVLARQNALKAQDRIIRLEEHLRYQRVLPAELAAQATARLTPSQNIALRFAGDNELADLVSKALAGTLAEPGEIKKAIKNWRGDYFRV